MKNNNQIDKKQGPAKGSKDQKGYSCGSKVKYSTCRKCGFKSKNKSEQRKHIYYSHEKPALMSQLLMKKSSSANDTKTPSPPSTRDASNEIKTSHPLLSSSSLACSHCRFLATGKYSLRCHEAKHREKSAHQCPLCTYSVSNASHLSQHIKRVHSAPGILPESSKDKVNEDKKLLCSASIRRAVIEDDVDDDEEDVDDDVPHAKTDEDHQTHVFGCSSCSFWGANLKNLQIHESLHVIKSAFQCHKCSYSSTSITHLKLHLKRDHPLRDPDNESAKAEGDKEVLVYRCSMCAQWRRSVNKFHHHFLAHQSEPAFKCSNCDFSSKARPRVTVHMRKEKKLKRGSHSDARLVILEPIPSHRYSAFRRPMIVIKGACDGQAVERPSEASHRQQKMEDLRKRVEVMEGKVEAALEEEQEISNRRRELKKRMAHEVLEAYEKEDEELLMDLKLAESSRIGAEEVLRILREELKSF